MECVNICQQNRDRVRQAAAYYCDRLGAYRMPFAWTAAYLMNVVAGSHSMETDYSKTDSLGKNLQSFLAVL